GMTLLLERAQERMHVEPAKAAPERLVLLARQALVPEEQHPMPQEPGLELGEGVVAELGEVDAHHLGPEGPGDRMHRDAAGFRHRVSPPPPAPGAGSRRPALPPRSGAGSGRPG